MQLSLEKVKCQILINVFLYFISRNAESRPRSSDS